MVGRWLKQFLNGVISISPLIVLNEEKFSYNSHSSSEVEASNPSFPPSNQPFLYKSTWKEDLYTPECDVYRLVHFSIYKVETKFTKVR